MDTERARKGKHVGQERENRVQKLSGLLPGQFPSGPPYKADGLAESVVSKTEPFPLSIGAKVSVSAQKIPMQGCIAWNFLFILHATS